MKSNKNQILIEINAISESGKLVQIIELAAHKLDLKTISVYAKCNNLSYNGVKKCRSKVLIGGVKFVADGLIENQLPF